MYFSTGSEAALMVQPRNLVIVGENSHVQIIERHQSLNENQLIQLLRSLLKKSYRRLL
jgi:Fe-S cluster assembly protein SufD